MDMRMVWMLVVLVAVNDSQVVVQGQQTATNALVSATNAIHQPSSLSLSERSAMELRLTEPRDTNSLYYVVSKTEIHVSGPLIVPLKAKSASDFGHRVLHLFSPFASEEPAGQPAAVGPVNTRAWSTVVGWSPGRSAFPDGTWHEPAHLNLISVNVEKQPSP
jgi:hypothetical protein